MREDIKRADIIVIKVGTSLLVSPETGIIESAISKLASVLAQLMRSGKKIILVSSGAVGAGTVQLGEVSKYAAAAVGRRNGKAYTKLNLRSTIRKSDSYY